MSEVFTETMDCTWCGTTQSISEFQRSKKSGKLVAKCSSCRTMYNAAVKAPPRTWEGKWMNINKRTVNGSNPRWDIPQCRRYLEKGVRLEMTRAEFDNWCRERWNEIDSMYRDAEEFRDRGLLPSVDRIDSNGHYSVDNIRIVTWAENSGWTS